MDGMLEKAWGDLSFQRARAKHVALGRASINRRLLEPRNVVLAINGKVGALCDCFCWRSALECENGLGAFTKPEKEKVTLELASAFALLLLLADQCNIDLPQAAQLKIQLNAKKYPANLVRGSALKYDAYQEHTGFAKGSKQVTTEGEAGDDHLLGCPGRAWSGHTLEDLRVQLEQFADDRGWQKFHTARNICLALSGEAGELCELFQFKDEHCCSSGLPGWTRDARDKLAQEVSDVCIYLCRLADVCSVDLTKALEDDHLAHLSWRTILATGTFSNGTENCGGTDRSGPENRLGYLVFCLVLGVAVMTSWVRHT